VKDLYEAQPEEVKKHIDFKERHGILGALRTAYIDSSSFSVKIPRQFK